jgi:hypothetical protein
LALVDVAKNVAIACGQTADAGADTGKPVQFVKTMPEAGVPRIGVLVARQPGAARVHDDELRWPSVWRAACRSPRRSEQTQIVMVAEAPNDDVLGRTSCIVEMRCSC